MHNIDTHTTQLWEYTTLGATWLGSTWPHFSSGKVRLKMLKMVLGHGTLGHTSSCGHFILSLAKPGIPA